MVRRARPKSVKRPTFHWANLSGIKLDRINKATALYHSRGINHQNHVRDLRFSKLISGNGLRRQTCRCIFGHQTWQKFSKTTNRNIYKPSHGFDDWCLLNDTRPKVHFWKVLTKQHLKCFKGWKRVSCDRIIYQKATNFRGICHNQNWKCNFTYDLLFA